MGVGLGCSRDKLMGFESHATNKQTNVSRKNLFNSTLGSSKTIYNIFDRINEKARIVQRKAHKHTRQSKVFNLFYRFIGRNMRMFPEITSDKRLKSATRVMRVCINYEVAIIWRFKSICISLLKKAPDHWSHVILITRLFHFRCHLRIVFWPSFLLVKLFQRHREVWTWIYSRSMSKVDCLSSGVSNYLTCVRYNIPFMQITICVVLVCVYCSDFLCSKYASHLSKFISYVSFQLRQTKKYHTFRLSSIGWIIKLTKL